MKYRIDSGFIIEKFKTESFCPLCAIEKTIEESICRELLGDGCMDDDVRRAVNEKGFCEKHFDLLYSLPSKLGLALQMQTRITSVAAKLTVPTNAFSAKKYAKILLKESDSCIVCDLTKEEMQIYYATIARLYAENADFRSTFASCNGFCNKHFANLLNHAKNAATRKKQYLKSLTDVQQKRFSSDLSLLKQFAARHDYRNIGKPLGKAEKALPNIRQDLYGKK